MSDLDISYSPHFPAMQNKKASEQRLSRDDHTLFPEFRAPRLQVLYRALEEVKTAACNHLYLYFRVDNVLFHLPAENSEGTAMCTESGVIWLLSFKLRTL